MQSSENAQIFFYHYHWEKSEQKIQFNIQRLNWDFIIIDLKLSLF